MNARDVEAEMLMRCAAAAHGSLEAARDQREANVFRIAAMVIQSRFPDAATRLMKISEDYFSLHPDDRLPAVEVVKKGWIFTLPRLRDMLSFKLR